MQFSELTIEKSQFKLSKFRIQRSNLPCNFFKASKRATHGSTLLPTKEPNQHQPELLTFTFEFIF